MHFTNIFSHFLCTGNRLIGDACLSVQRLCFLLSFFLLHTLCNLCRLMLSSSSPPAAISLIVSSILADWPPVTIINHHISHCLLQEELYIFSPYLGLTFQVLLSSSCTIAAVQWESSTNRIKLWHTVETFVCITLAFIN